MEIPTLFWPVPRAIIRTEDRNTSELHRLRSLIAYQILFGGRLVIRDTDYINGLAFRNAVQKTLNGIADEHSAFIRALLDDSFIIIARQEEMSLAEVAQEMDDNARSPVIPDRLFRADAEDIAYLESDHSPGDRSLRYSRQQAALYYERELRRMLSQSLEPYIDDALRRRAHERVAEHLENHSTISWRFFRPNGAFWDGFSDTERDRYGHFFDYILGQAPHAGFIPHALGLSPIYMHDVADAIDVWRGRHLRPKELIEESTIRLGTGFSFSDYVEYLAVLPVGSLYALLEKDENREFRQTCELFSTQQATFADVQRTYTNYRKVIDSELLRQSRMLPQSGATTNLRAFLGRAREEGLEHTIDIVSEEVIGTLIPFWRLALKLFYRVARGEWPDERKLRMARESEADNIVGEIHRLQGDGEKFSQKVIAEDRGSRDRVVSESSNSLDADVCVAGAATPN